MVAANPLRWLRLALALLHGQDQPAPLVAVGMSTDTDVLVDAVLSAQHLVAQLVEDEDGVQSLQLADGFVIVEIDHEVGNDEAAAKALDQAAAEMRRHAERIRRQARRLLTYT